MTLEELNALQKEFYIPELTVDLYKKRYVHVVVKESDNCRYVLFLITANGNGKDMSKFTCNVKLLKPDGAAKYEVADMISDGRVLVHFTDDMLSVSGYAEMSLTFTDGTNVISTLDNIKVDIESQPYPNKTIISDDSFDALNEQIEAVNKVLTQEIDHEKNAAKSASESKQSASDSKKYYDKTLEISQSIIGALKPRGTFTIEQVMSKTDVSAGDMFNISNDFVSTANFKDGSGISYPKGTNIYYTTDKMWDVFVSPGIDAVIVSGEEPQHQNKNTIWLKPKA